jgi:hypothetical protein
VHTLSRVSLRVQSGTLTLDRLSELMGTRPDHGVDAGRPVSSRLADGPVHTTTTWVRISQREGDRLHEHLAQLLPAPEVLARVRAADPKAGIDLVLMLDARPFGAMVDIEVEVIERLAAATCGIVIDAYDSA